MKTQLTGIVSISLFLACQVVTAQSENLTFVGGDVDFGPVGPISRERVELRVAEPYLYMLGDRYLTVIDISDKSNPQVVGRVAAADAFIDAIIEPPPQSDGMSFPWGINRRPLRLTV